MGSHKSEEYQNGKYFAEKKTKMKIFNFLSKIAKFDH